MVETIDVPAMEARGLLKRYKGGVQALTDATFSVMPGESVGYLGPNGAGKSTTIKIFTTLIKPTKGQAYLNGYNITTKPKKALASVGSLVEVPGLYDYLTPREMLSYVGKVYGMHKHDLEARTEEIMKTLGLGDWIDKRLRTFSTGMRRRYSIGQAVLHDPSIVILDEPVLGLDPAGIREIRHFLQNLKKEGKTVFLSSHLLGEVEEVCDRVMLINHGQILAEESLTELRESMTGGYLILYQGTPPQNEVDALTALSGVSRVDVEGTQVKVHAADGLNRSTLATTAMCGGTAQGIWPITPSLEDMYIKFINNEKSEEVV